MRLSADRLTGGLCYINIDVYNLYQFDKLEFGGESPLTMRAGCYAFRYCPDPLGIVTTELLDKLEFDNIKAA